MSKPDDIPEWAWEKAEDPAEACFDGAVDLYETGMESTSLQAVIARAILSAVEEEREGCAIAAYSVPNYTVGMSDFDERGRLKPGSPYDAGRYDAAAAIRNRKEA